MYKLTINGEVWTGDIHDAPVKSGDVVECDRPIVFERPTYLWEGVEGITFHCPNRFNVLMNPYDDVVIYWPDGTEAARYEPAPWTKDWVTPDGLGRVGNERLALRFPEVEDQQNYIESVMRLSEEKRRELVETFIALDKPAEQFPDILESWQDTFAYLKALDAAQWGRLMAKAEEVS